MAYDVFLLMLPPPPTSTLFPYTTLFRSRCTDSRRLDIRPDKERLFLVVVRGAIWPRGANYGGRGRHQRRDRRHNHAEHSGKRDRKSTRLNSSHITISYAVFCLKKKTYISSSWSPTPTGSPITPASSSGTRARAASLS